MDLLYMAEWKPIKVKNMAGFAIPAMVSAIGGLVGAGLNERAAYRANERAFEQTKELFGMQQADRDEQNRWNSPAHMVSMLKAAGLSPASFYGGAAQSAGSAGVATPGHAEVSVPDLGTPITSAANSAASAILSEEQLKLNKDRTAAEIESLHANAAKAFSDSAKTDFERKQAEDLRSTVIERAKADLSNAYKQGVVLEKEALLKDVDRRYREVGIDLTNNEISLNDKQKELIDGQLERLGFENAESVSRIKLNASQANLADATANEICYRVKELLPAMVSDFCASKDLKSAQYWNTEAQTDFQKYYNEHIDELLGDKVRAEIRNMDAETKFATARKVQSWIKLPGEVFKDISFGASAIMSGISGKGVSGSAGAYVMSTAM